MEIYSFANKNWTKLFKSFNIKNLKSIDEILLLKKAIVLLSDDKIDKISQFLNKLESSEVIITRLPSNPSSKLDKNELKALIAKALGITS
jgi:vacuolar-type H+-ATPase subunit F/Vma7